MIVSQHCVAAIASDAKSLWAFIQTDEVRLLIAGLPLLRAFLLLLLAIPMREAQDLACSIMVVAFILLLVIVGEADPLAKSQIIASCGDTGTIVAMTTETKAPGG